MNNEFRDLQDKIMKETFVENAMQKFGVSAVEKVFALAWERGHSEGEKSIVSELRDLIWVMNLVK
jgi:Cu2+-containing amine oxidase